MQHIAKRSGFTLVELAIVIVAIALIVAGIVAGQNLVAQAKLRSAIDQVEQYKVAMYTFQLQYGDLPGDYDGAFAIWGASCDSTASNCNGDADKQIDNNFADSADAEPYRAWQHLALAEVIPGSFTGQGAANTTDIGVNVPASRYKGGYIPLYTVQINAVSIPNEHYLLLFDSTPTNIWAASMTPAEMFQLDDKVDDGLPYQGNVLGQSSAWLEGGSNCFSGGGPTASSPYDLTISQEICVPMFNLGL